MTNPLAACTHAQNSQQKETRKLLKEIIYLVVIMCGALPESGLAGSAIHQEVGLVVQSGKRLAKERPLPEGRKYC